MVGPALMYIVFGLCFLVLTQMMDLTVSSDVFQSSIKPILHTPWSQRPLKIIHDVKNGPDIFEWISKAFLNRLYEENPVPGDRQGYCSTSYKCQLNEGDVDVKERCAFGLEMGSDNCPSYMASGSDCCDICNSDGCAQPFNVPTASALPATTKAVNLSESCEDEMPGWLTELKEWSRGENAYSPPAPPGSSVSHVSFCPERQGKVSTNIEDMVSDSGRQLMVGQYNRALMARISLKRWQLSDHTSKAFSNAYPRRVTVLRTDPSRYKPAEENMRPFGLDKTESYQKDKGYQKAGGFVSLLDFDQPKERVLAKLKMLQRNFWFDLNQGSLVLEMILFNGNVDRFVYVAFVFKHDFSGTTFVEINVNALNLSLHDTANPETYARFFLYAIVVLLFIVFCKNEFEDMNADYATYFTNPMQLLHMTSLVLVAVSIGYYMRVVLSYSYRNFELGQKDEDEKMQDFEDLAELFQGMENFMLVQSMSLFLILFRCMTLIFNHIPQAGVIFNTFYRMRKYLAAFFVIFSVTLLGFTFSAHYLFGTRLAAYQMLQDSFLASIRMMFKEATRNLLRKGDPTFSFAYFMVFHLLFLIIQQLLISVLIYGYEKEREHIQTLMESDRSPTRKLLKTMTEYIRRKGKFILRCFVQFRQILIGSQGGGAVRANYQRVGDLRDLRKTKPSVRIVVYEQKDEEEKKDKEDARDTIGEDLLGIYKTKPYYPGGMYHFFVGEVKQDGQASEIGVRPDMRLVGISRAGQKEDRREFRNDTKWISDEKFPGAFLDHLQDTRPVTLVFEGNVKLFSRECWLLLAFMLIFVAFGVFVNRVEDSYSISAIHNAALKKPHWYSYNPTRITSLETISSVNGLNSWISNAVLAKEYECVTDVKKDQDCRTSDLTEYHRENWDIWAGPGKSPGDLRGWDSTKPPHTETPEAALGLSLGWLPAVKPQTDKESVDIDRIVRTREYNVGVMPNNHVRLTMQVACFQENPGKRWKRGYPWILANVFKEAISGCSQEPCMRRMQEQVEATCYNSNGDKRTNVDKINGDWSDITYQYHNKGTFRDLGGIAVGLGNTRYEADKVVNFLVQDQLFKANAVSFVLEFVCYNANFDLFSYTSVRFDLMKTGKLEHAEETVVFPVDVFSMGSTKTAIRLKTLNEALFGLYITVFLMFFVRFGWDLHIQYQITQALNKQTYMFLIDFFLEDWWNVVDIVSVFLHVLCIQTIINFMMIDGTIKISKEGIKSWTGSYKFITSVTKRDGDPFWEFQQAADLYRQFSELVAVNGCILLIRCCKYFNGLTALRMVMRALSSAISELMIMMISFLIFMLSFSYMFFTRYAVQYKRFSTLADTFIHLFLFLNGSFNTEELINNSPSYFLFVFVVFQGVFLLVMNMFLAAITTRWKEERKDAQEVSVVGAFMKLKEATQETGALNMLKSLTPTQSEDVKVRKFDKNFWQQTSALRHLPNLDETGRIRFQNGSEAERFTPMLGNSHEQEDEGSQDDEEGSQAENGKSYRAKETDEIKRKLHRNFKKAHMEIASEMCRKLAPPREDRGAGVGAGFDDDDGSQGEAAKEEQGEKEEFIGILEDATDEGTISKIEDKIRHQLDEEHPVKEIWLDALVTVLEEKGTLEKLQEFFRPPPMVKPTRPHEQTQYNEKKRKMEQRLNLFLKWLQQESDKKHLEYVKDMADDKEKNLKQQSLVLTDYLETLDSNIEKLENEIKEIDNNSSRLRQHVSPLL